jgi:hypothetical protein
MNRLILRIEIAAREQRIPSEDELDCVLFAVYNNSFDINQLRYIDASTVNSPADRVGYMFKRFIDHGRLGKELERIPC